VTRVQTTGDSGVGYGSVDTYVQSFVYNDALARLTSTVTTISPVAGGTAEPPFMQSLTYLCPRQPQFCIADSFS